MSKHVTVQLDDKYTVTKGRVFLTGTQALVRLPMTQQQRDMKKGFSTAGYISGYRGSPLGGFDDQLGKASKFLAQHHTLFVPGVNEDLAATAIWGTQQAEIGGEGKYDGVFGLWYGKGPGVDRTGDVFRHANLAGTSKLGGVLVLMGDDHTCESSTTCHQSEFAMVDAMIPILSPAGVQEVLDYGVYGWALSRFSGCWVGMKCVKDTVEATAIIDVDIDRVQTHDPEDFVFPPDGINIRLPDTPHAQEARLHDYKLQAVRKFAQVNPIDKLVIDSGSARFGVITHGKSYLDVLQALDDLDITEAKAEQMGFRLYKLGLIWPIEPDQAAGFASGLEKILVVEEKRSFIEVQLKELLYGQSNAPSIIGKLDEQGRKLLQPEMALNSNQIAIAIAERLLEINDDTPLRKRLEILRSYNAPKDNLDVISRTYYFCSGCPHNTSTILPEGSKGYAGIGCHWMSQSMKRATTGYTQMGGEGLAWVGEAPFSKREHMFQNLGDGTYFHSGLLAIRAAVAARTNITYKILFNDAVAMTGGQKHDGPLDVPSIARQVQAEGVKDVVVVADDTTKYPESVQWPEGVRIYQRDELEEVQKSLRDIKGTTVLIYDQTCAAEKRRRRKRGTFPDPQKRIMINDLVCEGCGDCGAKSNCVSVQPLETEFGRKRTIDQSSCNKDYSCIKGFCPSFVTVIGGKLRMPDPIDNVHILPALPEPTLPSLTDGNYSILVAGMGGTGVVTIGAILGMAAHLEGRGCGLLDMAGLAQKGGSVWSHLRFGASPESIKTIRIAPGGADLVLGCDLIVAGNAKTLALTRKFGTRMLVNMEQVMPGAFALDPDMQYPTFNLTQNIKLAVGDGAAEFIDAGRIATQLMGDSIATNMFLLGYAYQKELIPLSANAIEQAIDLNGAAKKMNKDAFNWGRRAAVDMGAVERILASKQKVSAPSLAPQTSTDLNSTINKRYEYLRQYHNVTYADRYLDLVEQVRQAETDFSPGENFLSMAVAKYYFKLLAIKDEYEVARLFVDTPFLSSLENKFEGKYKVVFNLAPPLFAKRDSTTGLPKKSEYGQWIVPFMKMLTKLRLLRNTPFDPFGYTAERKFERALIGWYEGVVKECVLAISKGADRCSYETLVAVLSLPERIRGYGHVRKESIEAVYAEYDSLIKTEPEKSVFYRVAS